MPYRIQRRRTRGWVAPPDTIHCGRGTPWGNPFRVGEPWPVDRAGWRSIWSSATRFWMDEARWSPLIPMDRVDVVHAHRQWMTRRLRSEPEWLEPLRYAAYLSCWCPIDLECHVDNYRDYLEATRPTAVPGVRPVFGITRMAGEEAEGAEAWPSQAVALGRARQIAKSLARRR